MANLLTIAAEKGAGSLAAKKEFKALTLELRVLGVNVQSSAQVKVEEHQRRVAQAKASKGTK